MLKTFSKINRSLGLGFREKGTFCLFGGGQRSAVFTWYSTVYCCSTSVAYILLYRYNRLLSCSSVCDLFVCLAVMRAVAWLILENVVHLYKFIDCVIHAQDFAISTCKAPRNAIIAG